MTSRFALVLSVRERITVLLLLAVIPTFSFPVSVAAQTSQNTQTNNLVFEIKSTSELQAIVQEVAPTPVVAPKAVARSAKPSLKISFPPKTTGDAKVYMHEPEIRAYICPRLGDKCNTFIAVLKAENGTHECTRDNRGLNKNGSVDIGLAQINWRPGYPHTFEQLQDCKYNLDVALEMYKRRGFQPWYAYTKGAYKKHMPAVLASAKALEVEASEPTTN